MLNYDKYKNTLPRPSRASLRKELDNERLTVAERAERLEGIDQKHRELRDAYYAEERRLIDMFKRDALDECGILGHPKADRAFEIAWDYGHASGLGEVFAYLSDLSDLLK